MKIAMIGKYFSNAGHGAECGIIDALESLGHDVQCIDFAAKKVYMSRSGLTGIPLEHADLTSQYCDFVLAVGPGLPQQALEHANVIKAIESKFSVLWNSEPIRLPAYMKKFKDQANLFDLHCTFDEGEIELYLNNGADACLFLPQAFNPKWYRPITDLESDDTTACFVGSIGGKWVNREYFLHRVMNVLGSDFTIKRMFDAHHVNRIYNQHRIVVNLGLYHAELGPANMLASYAFQQRIFETIGAGCIPFTNWPADMSTTVQQQQMFSNLQDIIYFDNSSLEAMLKFCMNNPAKLIDIQKNVLSIRENHTYKNRMDKLVAVVKSLL